MGVWVEWLGGWIRTGSEEKAKREDEEGGRDEARLLAESDKPMGSNSVFTIY